MSGVYSIYESKEKAIIVCLFIYLYIILHAARVLTLFCDGVSCCIVSEINLAPDFICGKNARHLMSTWINPS